MTLTRLLTAASVAAMIGGAAMAQTTSPTAQQNDSLPHTVGATNEPTQGYADQLPANNNADAQTTTSTTVGASTGVMDHSTMGANAATTAGVNTSTTAPTVTTSLTTNGPVPDTAENRSRYGQPLSRAGKASEPAGN